MPDTMIERVVTALKQEIAFPPDEPGEGWMVEGGYRSDAFFREAVVAVLTAMREPTEAMRMAGVKAPNYLEDQSSPRGCGNIFTAMIDAALAEGE